MYENEYFVKFPAFKSRVEFEENKTLTVVIRLLEHFYKLLGQERINGYVKPSEDLSKMLFVMEKYFIKDDATFVYCNSIGAMHRLKFVTNMYLGLLKEIPDRFFYKF